jgi:hydroxyethylthiazole kinase-like uncharacterized protein yjeF
MKHLPHKKVSALEIQQLDRLAIEGGIPSFILMENAGRGCAQLVLRRLRLKKNKQVCIVCGTGNNGGDGFVIARYLAQAHVDVHVFVIGDKKSLKQDPAINFAILKSMHLPLYIRKRWSKEDRNKLREAEMIVDALFGIGLNRPLENSFQKVIEIMNHESQYTVSIDVPSGLNATTGKKEGACIDADQTITFTFAKQGFFINDGPGVVGRLNIIDIGIPAALKDRIKSGRYK